MTCRYCDLPAHPIKAYSACDALLFAEAYRKGAEASESRAKSHEAAGEPDYAALATEWAAFQLRLSGEYARIAATKGGTK